MVRFDIFITAGSTYLDIDAYACMVAMAELLNLQGENAIAHSTALCNYSVCKSLIEDGYVFKTLPHEFSVEESRYIIVDVSDPDFVKDSVPLDKVIAVYDHHTGFEEYWRERIGDNAHIEFIGAAATLIYREWKRLGYQDKMTRPTAFLLIAAILDNTLNLTSSNTTAEDVAAFDELCGRFSVDKDWCAYYFSEVQGEIERDLKNAIFKDIKTIRIPELLPSKIAQLAIWNANGVLARLPEIRDWFSREGDDDWMLNLIDVRDNCSYFVCDNAYYQKRLGEVFCVRFDGGIARSEVSYLRKEIIKRVKA